MREDHADKDVREPIEQLIRLLTTAPDADACDRCRTELHEYVADQMAGADYTALHRQTAAHLDQCVACAEEYARLYDLALAERQDALALPSAMPEPDLSFLSPEGASLAERLAAALTEAGDRITLQFNERLLPWLRPPAPALAVRAAQDRYAEVLLRLAPEEIPGAEVFPLAVTAYRDAVQPDVCLVEVTVQPPGRSWPDLAGMTVTLGGVEPPRTAVTDAWGVAVFEAVPIAALGEMEVGVMRNA